MRFPVGSVPVSVRSRSEARPDLPSLMAGRALAMRARHYMPRSRSIDFGLGSIDLSAAGSGPRPRECPRPRSWLPDSRPPRWRTAPGSDRFPSRSWPVSTRGSGLRPSSEGASRPASYSRSVVPGARPGSRWAAFPPPNTVSCAASKAAQSSAATSSPVAFSSWLASFQASSVTSPACHAPG